jgi:hypothetical protein
MKLKFDVDRQCRGLQKECLPAIQMPFTCPNMSTLMQSRRSSRPPTNHFAYNGAS